MFWTAFFGHFWNAFVGHFGDVFGAFWDVFWSILGIVGAPSSRAARQGRGRQWAEAGWSIATFFPFPIIIGHHRKKKKASEAGTSGGGGSLQAARTTQSLQAARTTRHGGRAGGHGFRAGCFWPPGSGSPEHPKVPCQLGG